LQANKSALKAMLLNRVGDFFLLGAVMFLVAGLKTVDYLAIFMLIPVYSLKIIYCINGIKLSIVDFIAFFILLGAITKSAQLGLHG
jgi:NADH:ubiquinone oxidoreductase subunit 5 (subunit L)/multisubunit Na+/H+ antiporter MnhA subunit